MGSPFDTEGFLRRGECGDWSKELLWTMNCSDLVVAVSFVGISCLMAYVIRRRDDIPMRSLWIVLACATFVCGLTHLVATSMTFWPAWWVDAIVRAIAAVLCLATLTMFLWRIPRVIRIISPVQIIRQQTALTDAAEALVVELDRHGKDMTATTRRCMDQVKDRLSRIAEIRTELREVERTGGLTGSG